MTLISFDDNKAGATGELTELAQAAPELTAAEHGLEGVTRDPRELRAAFGRFPSGIAALCAEVDGGRHAMVVTSFSVGVSFNPPIVMFSVQNSSSTWPRLRASDRIGVSVRPGPLPIRSPARLPPRRPPRRNRCRLHEPGSIAHQGLTDPHGMRRALGEPGGRSPRRVARGEVTPRRAGDRTARLPRRPILAARRRELGVPTFEISAGVRSPARWARSTTCSYSTSFPAAETSRILAAISAGIGAIASRSTLPGPDHTRLTCSDGSRSG